MKRGDTVVKIRISYETPEELAEILKRLQPIGRVKQQDKGRYKRAYIECCSDQKPVVKKQ